MTRSRRFVSLPAIARFAILGLAMLAIAGAIIAVGPLQDYGGKHSRIGTDSDLYRSVAVRVEDGQGFYAASVDEQVERGYPVRPAMTVREPTLTWLIAAVGGWRNATVPLAALALLTGLAMVRRLEAIDPGRWFFALSGLGALAAFGPYVGPVQVTQHECWAGLLVVLSLTIRTSERFVLAAAVGLAACFFRELAAPYLVLMAIAALAERRYREARAWVSAGCVFAALYAAHLVAVGRETSGSDPRSPGWLARDGLPHVLETIRLTTFASAGPDVLSVLILVLGLLGWASVRSPLTSRVLAWVVFWVVISMFVGRPENIVWGFIWVGPLVLGLVLVPTAIRDLVAGNRGFRDLGTRQIS